MDKYLIFCAGILIGFTFLLICADEIPRDFVDIGGDSSQYIILAESLAQGQGYHARNFPGSPFFYKYPPFFPLFLAPIIFFAGRNFLFMHMLVSFCALGGLFLVYQIYRIYLDRVESLLLTGNIAFNAIFLFFASQNILSDIPYFCISMAVFVFLGQYAQSLKNNTREGGMLLFVLLLAYFTRYAGIILAGGVILYLALAAVHKKRERLSFILVGFLIPVFVWQITARVLNTNSLEAYSQMFFLIDPYKPYQGTMFSNPLFFFAARLIRGINFFYKALGAILFYPLMRWKINIDFLALISTFMVFLGLWQGFRKRKKIIFCYYFLVYFLVIVSWFAFSVSEMIRYLLPLMPFILFYFYSFLKNVVCRFCNVSVSRGIMTFVLIGFLLLNVFFLQAQGVPHQPVSRAFNDFLTLNRWMKHSLDKNGVVFSRKPAVTYLISGHQATIFPYTFDFSVMATAITRTPIKYIIADGFSPETYNYLVPFLLRNRDQFELLHSVGNTALFEVKGQFGKD